MTAPAAARAGLATAPAPARAGLAKVLYRLLRQRLGKYRRTLEPGMKFLVPVIDSVRSKVDMREQVVSFPPQPVITADNVTVQIDTVIYFLVTDAQKVTYGNANPLQAIEQLTTTTLRNVGRSPSTGHANSMVQIGIV